MYKKDPYHQLGRVIALFQFIEREINEIILRLANTDDEMVLILVNELEYFKRLKTADVLFSRYVDVYQPDETEAKSKFHKLIIKLTKLGERRNDLVHSSYIPWYDAEGFKGLIRENTKLSGGKGVREELEEEILPGSLDQDLKKISVTFDELNDFRLQIIEWQYPIE